MNVRKLLSISKLVILLGDGVLPRCASVWQIEEFALVGMHLTIADKITILSTFPNPRDEIRQVLHDHFDDEFDSRFVGSKNAIDRVPLNCLGPWHQLHSDGHEKLAAQALMMGNVTLPIYALKDQFSTFVPSMRVLPNVRLENTIGHFYLDFIEEFECMFLLGSH